MPLIEIAKRKSPPPPPSVLRAWVFGSLRVAAKRLSVLPSGAREAMYAYGSLGYWPNLRRPRTFHEHLIAHLVANEDPRRAQLADKLAAKAYVARTTPWIRTAEVYTSAASAKDLDLKALPSVSVLKANNSSGRLRVLQQPFDVRAAQDVADRWLRADPAPTKVPLRWERHYAEIPPRVFVEEHLGTEPGKRIDDYRFYTFGGRVRMIVARISTAGAARRPVHTDAAWNPVPFYRIARAGETSPKRLDVGAPIPPPEQLPAMIATAERLAQGMRFVRVDLYLVDGSVYFGEMTFTPSAAMELWSDPGPETMLAWFTEASP